MEVMRFTGFLKENKIYDNWERGISPMCKNYINLHRKCNVQQNIKKVREDSEVRKRRLGLDAIICKESQEVFEQRNVMFMYDMIYLYNTLQYL